MNAFNYHQTIPDAKISDFVESFWMLATHNKAGQQIIVLPDGRIDVFFSITAEEPFHVTLSGIQRGL